MSDKKRKDPRGRERFDEYRRFNEAFNCPFKEWLKVRKTQWYDDMKNERLPHPILDEDHPSPFPTGVEA
jgi:hypothetical protein